MSVEETKGGAPPTEKTSAEVNDEKVKTPTSEGEDHGEAPIIGGLPWIDDEGTHSESIGMDRHEQHSVDEHDHSRARSLEDGETEHEHSDIHCPVDQRHLEKEIKEEELPLQDSDDSEKELQNENDEHAKSDGKSNGEHTSRSSTASNRSSNHRQSLMLRMRKSLRSKSISSRFGRKAVSKLLGDAGVSLLHNFKAAAMRDKGEKYGKQLKRRVLRTAIKVTMLIKSKIIALDRLTHLNLLALHIMRGLQRCLTEPEREAEKVDVPNEDIEALVEMFSQFTVELVLLFRTHISPKNLGKAKDTLNYWGGRHFLTLLLNDPAYIDENASVFEAINHMLKESHKNRTRVASIVES